jgi:hypothetical protein
LFRGDIFSLKNGFFIGSIDHPVGFLLQPMDIVQSLVPIISAYIRISLEILANDWALRTPEQAT